MSFRARLTIAAAVAVAIAVAVASVGRLPRRPQPAARAGGRCARRPGPGHRAHPASASSAPARTSSSSASRARSWAGPGGYVQVVRPAGRDPRARRRPRAPGRRADARGRRRAAGRLLQRRRGRRHPRPHPHDADRRRLRRSRSPGRSPRWTTRSTGCARSSSSSRSAASGSRPRSGSLVARTALAPVRRLTEATEEVTATRDLSRRMADEGTDELGRLAASFNTMLAALEDSARSQRRFVADASHELRTPLTSLRTNIEVLARADALPAEERERLLADVVEQLAEMSELVAELVALDRARGGPGRARGRAPRPARRPRRSSAPAGTRSAVTFTPDLEESVVTGHAGLDRARDRQPARQRRQVEPARRRRRGERPRRRGRRPRPRARASTRSDLPYVFDRFYRAPSARGLPGSGLGLAIVRQVAESPRRRGDRRARGGRRNARAHAVRSRGSAL